MLKIIEKGTHSDAEFPAAAGGNSVLTPTSVSDGFETSSS